MSPVQAVKNTDTVTFKSFKIPYAQIRVKHFQQQEATDLLYS
jgi:hypothetical protein